jgi:hypothetical protein
MLHVRDHAIVHVQVHAACPSVLHILFCSTWTWTCRTDINMQPKHGHGLQHRQGHVACIIHECIHNRFVLFTFAIFASDHIYFASIRFISYSFRFYSLHIIFVTLLFASYHIRFVSIRILNFLIRFEANISESNPSIRYFAEVYSLPDSLYSLRSEYEGTPYFLLHIFELCTGKSFLANDNY